MKNPALSCLAVLAVAALVPGPARAADAFKPESVFAMSAHNAIDSRCQDARTFADQAGKSTAAMDAQAAIAGAKSFMVCMHLPKVYTDEDAQRYLYLCATTAVYVAATKSQGDDALDLYKKSDAMARSLGASAPDKTVKVDHWAIGTLDAGVSAPKAGKDTDVVSHNPLGGGQIGMYTNVANEIVTAIDAKYPEASGAAKPAASASPAASPSASPAAK